MGKPQIQKDLRVPASRIRGLREDVDGLAWTQRSRDDARLSEDCGCPFYSDAVTGKQIIYGVRIIGHKGEHFSVSGCMTMIENLRARGGLLTVKQVAEVLGCHPMTVYGWCAEPCIQF